MKVAYLQYDIIWQNSSENLIKINSHLTNELGGIDLLVLPEMFHCGFTMNPEVVAQKMNGEVVEWMKNLASEKQIAIAGSVVVNDNDRFYNRLIFVLPNGDVKWYDKRHLFRMGKEDECYYPGESHLTINYKGFRIRPLICYDLRFPVWSRNRNDYDLLIYVANWPSSRQNVWNTLLSARAMENQSYVVGVNRIGRDNTNFYAGGSAVYNYKGERMSCAEDSKESLVICDLDIEKLLKFRTDFPAYLDADQFKII